MQRVPEVEYRTTMQLPPEAIWEFVKDMNNWAPFLTGYQKHEIIDDTDSVWTLKGDVGILARIVELRAHITEWDGPQKVSFTLTGLNEKVDGGGELRMRRTADAAEEPAPAPRKKGLFARFLEWMFRKMFRRMHGEGPKRLQPAPGGDGELSELVFTLRMEAGGPTGPLVNAMLGPAMLPAAEDLANKIAAHLEQAHGVRGAA